MGTGLIGGSSGLRGAVKKVLNLLSILQTFLAKVEYYGILGLRLGLAGYFGRTQAADEVDMLDGADVGMSMVGLDARYSLQAFYCKR